MRRLRKLLPLTLWLALTLLSAMPLRAQTPQPTMTLAEYRAELAAAITELESAPPDDEAATLDRWQQRLDEITRVDVAANAPVNVRAILEGIDPFITVEANSNGSSVHFTPKDAALARLRSAVAQIDAAATDNTAARLATLAAILARPEFNTPMSLWDRFWQWLEQLIRDLLPDAEAGGSSGWLAQLIRLLPWLVAVLVVAAILWLLSYWLQRFLRSFVTDARLAAATGEDDLPRSAAEARQQARAAAESGMYRDAVRRLYLAALLQLAEHNLITYERSLTNREVLVRIPQESPIRPHLEPVIATFDRVWYGIHEPDQATFATYEQEIDALAAVAQRTAFDATRRGSA